MVSREGDRFELDQRIGLKVLPLYTRSPRPEVDASCSDRVRFRTRSYRGILEW